MGMMVCRVLLPTARPFSPDRRKDRHIVVTRPKAVRTFANYDPIGAMQSRNEVTELRAQLSMDYKIHQLTGYSFLRGPRVRSRRPRGYVIAGDWQGKTANDESLARDKGGGRNPSNALDGGGVKCA